MEISTLFFCFISFCAGALLAREIYYVRMGMLRAELLEVEQQLEETREYAEEWYVHACSLAHQQKPEVEWPREIL